MNILMKLFVDTDLAWHNTYVKLLSSDKLVVASGFGELWIHVFQREIPDADLEQGKYYEEASRIIVPVL